METNVEKHHNYSVMILENCRKICPLSHSNPSSSIDMTGAERLKAPTPSAWSVLRIISKILWSFTNRVSALSKKLNLTPLNRHTLYKPQRREYNDNGGYGSPYFWRVSMTRRHNHLPISSASLDERRFGGTWSSGKRIMRHRPVMEVLHCPCVVLFSVQRHNSFWGNF